MNSGMKRFIIKVVLLLAGIVIPFCVLFELGYLPVITESGLFDSKALTSRQKEIKHVDLMAMGSSMTMYELNSDIMVKNFRQSYYNFACWNLQIGDSYTLLKTYIPQYKPDYLIIFSSFGDFTWPTNSSYHNYADAPALMRGRLPGLFYFKNFSAIRRVIDRKQTYKVKFDNWGGAQMVYDPRNDKHKFPVFPTANTSIAYRSLDSLAAMLQGEKIQLIFIQTPVRHLGADSVTRQHYQVHFNRCRDIITRHSGIYLNYDRPAIFTADLFADPYHLKPAGSKVLTENAVLDLKKIIK